MAVTLPPDVMLPICEHLANYQDFGTLFNCAISGKQLAVPALMFLYKIHGHASIRGGESNDAEMSRKDTSTIAARISQQKRTVSRWAMQWRSIILSSVRGTLYPYCLYIKSLDLVNLEELLDDNIFRDVVQDDFFSKEMNRFKFLNAQKRTRSSEKKPRLIVSSIVESVGTAISAFLGTSASISNSKALLEEFSGNRMIGIDSLCSWIENFSRLKSITLWDGSILDSRVGAIIGFRCQNFDTLNIYSCLGVEQDIKLAAFFNALPNDTIRSFHVYSFNQIAEHTFNALSKRHGKSLCDLAIAELTEDGMKSLSSLQQCLSLRSLDLHDNAGYICLQKTENDTFVAVVKWLSSCKDLKSLRLKSFVDASEILKPVCLSEDISLRNLAVIDYTLANNDMFHQALENQTCLASLELRGSTEESHLLDKVLLISPICQLKELRYLNLLDISDAFLDSDVSQLARSLPKLEDLSISGYSLTDSIWTDLLTLQYLCSLSFHALTRFTFQGILDYISCLSRTNEGLLLSVMCQMQGFDLSQSEQVIIRKSIAEKVNGKFEFVLYREAEDDSDDSNDGFS